MRSMISHARGLALASALLTLGASDSALAQAGKTPQLLPVDQAASQPDFFSFRAQLQTVIARRDAQALLAVVHPNIKNSFDGAGGIAEFKKTWALDKPDSRLWGTLAGVLAMGGSFGADNTTFVAPYTYSLWPREMPAYGHVAVIGSNVRVRAKPSASAGSVGTVSFQILEEVETKAPLQGWAAVRVADDKVGYIGGQFVRSRTDYRATFERSGSSWKLVKLLNGD